ncbi:MAG: hypothetical protein EZS28_004476 [Streblomastix strix]|uniref:Uncharacterized protein n=1 Tax=Streblomastix strix TaxID=222440 RepID=A0A5J4WYR5_9EUKA|nr:MAG: hypothetical protein EZS28_004476 [Streblomastix strix]
MVAGPTIVYKLNESVKQVLYSLIVQQMTNQGTKHGQSKKLFKTWKDSSIPHGPVVENVRTFLTQIIDKRGLSRGAQQLHINGQRFETQRHYFYAMRTLAEFSYEHSPSIDQPFSISPGFLLLEVINWFTRWNPKQEIRRSVLIQHCSLGLIVYIDIMGWILNKLRTFFWKPSGQPADKQRISLWLNSLLREIGFHRATVYSFKRAASTVLARLGLDTTKLNIFADNSVFSRATSNQYIYMLRMQISMISRLSSWEVTVKATLYKPSHNKEVEQLNKVIQVHYQGVIHNTLVVVRCYGVQLLNLLPSHLMRPYPSVEELNPTDNTGARSDMIYIDQYDNDDMSRQQNQWSSWNANELEY